MQFTKRYISLTKQQNKRIFYCSIECLSMRGGRVVFIEVCNETPSWNGESDDFIDSMKKVLQKYSRRTRMSLKINTLKMFLIFSRMSSKQLFVNKFTTIGRTPLKFELRKNILKITVIMVLWTNILKKSGRSSANKRLKVPRKKNILKCYDLLN